MFRVLNSYNKVTFERGLIGAYINLRRLNCIIRIDNNSYLVIIAESILKCGDQRIDDHLRYEGDIVDLEHPSCMEGGYGRV